MSSSDRVLTNWSRGVYLTSTQIHMLECGRCKNMVLRSDTAMPMCRVHNTHVVRAREGDMCGDEGRDFDGWPWDRVPFFRALRFLKYMRRMIYRSI